MSTILLAAFAFVMIGTTAFFCVVTIKQLPFSEYFTIFPEQKIYSQLD